jgi:hypothetical protein|tara:strand:- start:1197 stop:1808 length:612 start_codon:yes stop_codon:yes gene_type:complete
MIIGVCGLIGGGKGTVGDILVEHHNFEKLSFADKLKDAVARMFDWDRELLEGITKESRTWREQKDTFWSNETGRNITPRLVLQEFGTDCMRKGFYDGVWVSMIKNTLIQNPHKNYVIPDVRFPNEGNMIAGLGGQVWRVRRGTDPMWLRIYEDIGQVPTDVHESEYKWCSINHDTVINNDQSMDYLKNLVASHLASILPQSSV